MDSLIAAAAQALAAGDAFGALNRVALRDDPPALALRGIAMARLGDFDRARMLLRKAGRAFGLREPIARARCVVAEAEIAFAARELAWPLRALDDARTTLERSGDRVNAAHARHLDVRQLVLIGRLDEAERKLAAVDPRSLPATLRAMHELIAAGIAVRRLKTKPARAALTRAELAAREARIPALAAEVESAMRTLDAPAARLIAAGERRSLRLEDVETLFRSKALIVDECRYAVRSGRTVVSLTRRPVLFALARALAEAWPGDVSRGALLVQAFRARHADELHRARLRVEIGRLRRMLQPLADIAATRDGFALTARPARKVITLARPVDEEHAAVLAFLADGEAWSSSALALALGESQRTTQRALEQLAAENKAQSFGHGRARRWITPPAPGFATILLLPTPLPGG